MEIGTGSKRMIATNGAAPERPLTKELVAMPPKSIGGNINRKPTNAMPEAKTLTHQGHSTNRLRMDSSLRTIKFWSCLEPSAIHPFLLIPYSAIRNLKSEL
jgi:hypothetical protein